MSKPRKLPAAPIKRMSLECAEIGGWLAARTVPISAANEFIDDGLQGISYDSVKRGGQDSTGPERAAMSGRTDDVGKMAGDFMRDLEEAHRLLRRCRLHAVKLAVDWDEASRAAAEGVARRSNEAAGSGDCSNCGRLVSGSSVDRLRNGRCNACRVYWDRNGVERPKALWGSDSTDDRCVAVGTHYGNDVRCGLAAGHDGDHQFAHEGAVA